MQRTAGDALQDDLAVAAQAVSMLVEGALHSGRKRRCGQLSRCCARDSQEAGVVDEKEDEVKGHGY